MTDLVMILLVAVFAATISFVVIAIIRAIVQWVRNNHSPVLTIPARVVAKRHQDSTQQVANAGDPTGAKGYTTYQMTTYFATFEAEDGTRREFTVKGREYGMLSQGDRGMLTYQGTRYKGFHRL